MPDDLLGRDKPTATPEEAATDLLGRDVSALPSVPTPDRELRPYRDIPDLEGDLFGAARDEFAEADDNPEALAVEHLQRVRDRPSEVQERPTGWEQVELTFLPHVIREDNRPISLREELKLRRRAFLVGSGDSLLGSGLESLGVPEDLANPGGYIRGQLLQAAGADSYGEPIRRQSFLEGVGISSPPSEAEGLAAENTTLWMLRVLGHGMFSLVQEGIYRAPTGEVFPGGPRAPGHYAPTDVTERVRKTLLDEGLAAAIGDYADIAFADNQQFGTKLLGLNPSERGQRIRRANSFTDFIQGWLERVERGDGFFDDLYWSAVKSGEMNPNVAAGVGLAMDILVPLELGVLKPTQAAAGVVRRYGEVKKLLPTNWQDVGPLFWQTLSSNEIRVGEWLGDRVARAVESGGVRLDQLPQEWRTIGNVVSLDRYGLTLDEMAARNLPTQQSARTGDSAFQAQRTAAQQLHADAPVFIPSDARAGTMRGFWDYVTREGAATPRPHDGYHAMKHLDPDPELGIRSIRYELRNELGEVVNRGPLDWLTKKMIQRGLPSDELWRAGTRRIAHWDIRAGRLPKGASPLRIDRMFSSPEEAAEVGWRLKRLSKRHKSARPDGVYADTPEVRARLQQHLDGRSSRPVLQDAAARVRADVLTDAPFARSMVSRPTTPVGEVLADTARIMARNRMGTDVLQMLPNGSMMPKAMADRAMREVDATLRRAGLSADDLKRAMPRRGTPEQEGLGPLTARLSDGQEGEVSRLTRALGIQQRFESRAANTLSIEQWTSLRNGILQQVGGVLASTRYRAEALPRLADAVQDALADGLTKRKDLEGIARVVRDSPVARALAAVLDDPLRGLPQKTRNAWQRLSTMLERNTEEMVREVKALIRDQKRAGIKDLDPIELLRTVLGRHLPQNPDAVRFAQRLTPRQVEAMDKVDASIMRDNALLELRRQGLTKEQIASSSHYRWLAVTGSEDTTKAGLIRYGREVRGQAARSARNYLQSVADVGYRGGARGTDLADRIKGLNQATLMRVYHEVFERGVFNGPELRAALVGAGVSPKAFNTAFNVQHALQNMVLRARGDATVSRVFDELLNEGIVVPVAGNQFQVNALTQVLTGEYMVPVRLRDGTTRLQSRLPEATVAWAHEQLARWGLDVAHPEVASTRATRNLLATDVVVDGQMVALPRHLRTELERLVNLQVLDSRDIVRGGGAPGRAMNWMMRTFKTITLQGMGLPNIAYFTGQMLSVVPTIWLTRGVEGVSGAFRAVTRSPDVAGELMRRLSGMDGIPSFLSRTPGGEVLKTADGRLFSIDELEETLRDFGINDSPVHIETAEGLTQLLARETGNQFDVLNIRATGQWWQDLLGNAAGSFDRMGRLSVFLDELNNGATLNQAGAGARKALLDYRAMNDWEKTYARGVVTFYAFLRKNADAHIEQLFRAPERVFAQMRGQHAMVSQGLTEAQMGHLTAADSSRFVLWSTDDVQNDTSQNQFMRLTSTPLGPAEFLNLFRMMVDGDRNAGMQLLNPLIGSFAVLGFDQTLGTGWQYDRYHANRIPPFMMEWPFRGFTEAVFGVGAAEFRPDIDDPMSTDDAATLSNGGVPSYWVAGGRRGLTEDGRMLRWRLWQMMRVWLGRPMHTGQGLSRTTGHTDARPEVTNLQELFSYLSGLDWRGVPFDRVIHATAREDYARRLQEEKRRIDK